MWLTKYAWNAIMHSIGEHERREGYLIADAKAREAEIVGLHGEIRRLQERLIEAEGKARGSAALADAALVRLNQLNAERDQLFMKVIDPTFQVGIRTPIVGAVHRLPGDGAIFDDPAESAPGAPGAPDEIPVEAPLKVEDLDAPLPGAVFQPTN